MKAQPFPTNYSSKALNFPSLRELRWRITRQRRRFWRSKCLLAEEHQTLSEDKHIKWVQTDKIFQHCRLLHPEKITMSHLNETGVRPHQNIKTPETRDPSAWVTRKNKPQVSHATCKSGDHTVVSVQHITNGNDDNVTVTRRQNQIKS